MSISRRAAVAVFLGGCLLAGVSLAGSEEVAPQVRRGQRLLRFLETKQTASRSPTRPDSLLQEMQSADLDLRGYLQSNPADVTGAVLLMNLYEIRLVIDCYLTRMSDQPETMQRGSPYTEIVERASAADTMNAALHYWRGRLYTMHEQGGLEEPSGTPRLPEAIREIRRAVALDPKQSKYREGLALLTLASGDEAGARDLFRQLGADHPIYLLLRDWERVPRIEGTVPWNIPSSMGTELTWTLMDDTDARTRRYTFHGTAQEFEKSCRKNWPSFHLLLDPDPARYPAGARRYAQHLRWEGQRLEPDAIQSDVSGGREPGFGSGGIWIEVKELRALATDPQTQLPGIDPGEIYCRIMIDDDR